MIDAPTELLAALASGALAGAGLIVGTALAVRARRLGRRLRVLEAELTALKVTLRATSGTSTRAEDRLRRIEQAAAQLNDRLGQLELRGDGRPYDHAIALVRHGGDAERLVSHFGLSRGEAELVSRVHGPRKAG